MNIAKFLYQLRNWRAHARAFFLGSYIWLEAKLLPFIISGYRGWVKAYGQLDIVVIRKDGTTLNLGCVGRRVVTTAFVNYLRDDLANAAGGADISTFKYHECGTGVVAEAITDTALGAPCTTVLNPDSTRAVGTQDNTTAKTYKSVGTFTFDGTATVTEHGIFNAAIAGTLLDRTVFAAVNIAVGESIQFTYSLTISDGG